MTKPTISVVIPNLDGARWLEGCLPSLAGAGAVHEVVVADDGSIDDSAPVARRHGARFLPGGGRTGFAATANRGIRAAAGDWIFLLNNDTEVAAGALGALTDAVLRRPDVDIFAPLVLSSRDRRSIDSAGLLLYSDGVARPRWHGLPGPPTAPREEEVLLASGAAMLVRTDLFRRVGMFDEGMVSYLEDVDWGLRAQRAGARALFVPSAVVYHHFSGTTGSFSAYKARRVERNRVVVAVRHLPLRTLLASPLWSVARWAALARAREAISDSEEGRGSLGAHAVLGLLQGLALVPRAIVARRRLRKDARLGDAEWRHKLRRFRASPGDFRQYGA